MAQIKGNEGNRGKRERAALEGGIIKKEAKLRLNERIIARAFERTLRPSRMKALA